MFWFFDTNTFYVLRGKDGTWIDIPDTPYESDKCLYTQACVYERGSAPKGVHAPQGGAYRIWNQFNNRAHNFRIVGTIRNDTENLSLDWQPLESKLLAAAAYVAARRMLYLRFQSGEIHGYFTFPAEQSQEFLEADSQGRYFLSRIRNQFPYNFAMFGKKLRTDEAPWKPAK